MGLKGISDAEYAALMTRTITPDEVAAYRWQVEQAFGNVAATGGLQRLDALVEKGKVYLSVDEHHRLWVRFRVARMEELTRRRRERDARRTRGGPAMWDPAADEVAAEERRKRQKHARRQQAQAQRANLMALNRTLAQPHRGVDLRKVRGRVDRAVAHLDQHQAAALLGRYQAFADAVRQLRQSGGAEAA